MKKLHDNESHGFDLDEIINDKPVDIMQELIYKKRFTILETFFVALILAALVFYSLILIATVEMI